MFTILNPHSHSGNLYSEMNGRNCFGFEPYFGRQQLMLHPWAVLAREIALRNPTNSNKKLEKSQLVTLTDDKFEIKLDVSKFSPSELNVKVVENTLFIEGKHEERDDRNNFVSHNFIRKFQLPNGVVLDQMTSSITANGVLEISSPVHIEKPKPKEITVPIKFVVSETQPDAEAEHTSEVSQQKSEMETETSTTASS